jgi:hypothetical protein
VTKDEAEAPDSRMATGTWYRHDVSGFKYYDFWYTDPDDFYNFLNSTLVYTARTEMFTTRIPHGFTKIDI